MTNSITSKELEFTGISSDEAAILTSRINELIQSLPPELAWQKISKEVLTTAHPFQLHHTIFKSLFPAWPEQLDSAPAWIPDDTLIKSSNLSKMMSELGIPHLKTFHNWSIQNYQEFWGEMAKKLNIVFQEKPDTVCDLSNGIESPQWFKNAKLNIVDSCFNAPSNKPAIIYQNEQHKITFLSYGELNQLSNRIANSLVHFGFKKNDCIAIDMPMNHYAVAIYLGIIKMGGVVVSVADSFSADEIAIRLNITHTKAVFTQDCIHRDNKILPLYEKIIAAKAPTAIVLASNNSTDISLRKGDIHWNTFLVDNTEFVSCGSSPMDHCNILFSSGTTGNPKAIPWNHTTPIKAAADGYLHQNINPNDIIAWPTSLGWMMGPWLVFAGLINQATLALYTDAPQTRAFGEFIQNAKVTILGVVPSLVAHWRQSHCMNGLDWNSIKLFSSTGECSNPEDMLYLMSLASYKPIIEYCGGTEIGGAYISSTVCENNYPAVLTTPAMGLNFVLLDNNNKLSNFGEVALLPPSIGLSTEILNANHHDIYYANMPESDNKLRRHGDQLRRLDNGMYCALGRVDDTMNIGGIKVSSTEIERTLAGINNIIETAAIAVNTTLQGPSSLVIYAAIHQQTALSKENIKQEMQAHINQHLNPLFKIYDVIFVNELPKTASNKIMRRVLRNQYQDSSKPKNIML